jgi:hypothetical protein
MDALESLFYGNALDIELVETIEDYAYKDEGFIKPVNQFGRKEGAHSGKNGISCFGCNYPISIRSIRLGKYIAA